MRPARRPRRRQRALQPPTAQSEPSPIIHTGHDAYRGDPPREHAQTRLVDGGLGVAVSNRGQGMDVKAHQNLHGQCIGRVLVRGGPKVAPLSLRGKLHRCNPKANLCPPG